MDPALHLAESAHRQQLARSRADRRRQHVVVGVDARTRTVAAVVRLADALRAADLRRHDRVVDPCAVVRAA